MKLALVAALFALHAMALIGEPNDVTIGLYVYVDQFLESSLDLAMAKENATSARDAYENAIIGQQSNYNLGLLESELVYRESQLLAIENANIKLAFQTIFSSIASASALRFAIASEDIEASVYARSEELSGKEYISVRDMLIARMTYLQAKANTTSAVGAQSESQKALIRAIEGSMARLEIAQFELAIQMPEVPAIQSYVDRDPAVVKHRTNLLLYRERRSFLLESDSFSQAELEDIEETIVGTEGELQQRIWFLRDHHEQLLAQISAHTDSMQVSDLNVQVKSIDLEQARYQFESGDLYASDVAGAELALAIALEGLASLERSRLLLVIDVMAASNVVLREWIVDTWG